ncbi:hypothetical protein FNX48_015595, partial [Streptomyces sp. IF17]|nr:hypothetical protein [Streptomyces alkaliphilus]
VVLDHTAMVAADRGDTLISRLIHRAHAEPGWFLGAAACALVDAAGEGLELVDVDRVSFDVHHQHSFWRRSCP